jgi:hypothetical protein
MSKKISRRNFIVTSLATAAGVAGIDVAAKIADHYGLLAPDHSGIFGFGESLTCGAQRILMSRGSLACEFTGIRTTTTSVRRVQHAQEPRLPATMLDVRPTRFADRGHIKTVS